MQRQPPRPAPLPTKTPDKAPTRRRRHPRRNATWAEQRAETARLAATNDPFRRAIRPVSQPAGRQPLAHSGELCDFSLHKHNCRASRAAPACPPRHRPTCHRTHTSTLPRQPRPSWLHAGRRRNCHREKSCDDMESRKASSRHQWLHARSNPARNLPNA